MGQSATLMAVDEKYDLFEKPSPLAKRLTPSLLRRKYAKRKREKVRLFFIFDYKPKLLDTVYI